MPVHTHLFKRGATYYFRAKVPVDLQPHFGKAEEKYSLKTKDLAVARSLVRQASVDFDRRCTLLREKLKGRQLRGTPQLLDDRLIHELCELWRHQALAGDEETRMEGEFNDELDEQYAQRLQTREGLKDTLRRNDMAAVEPALQTFLLLNGIEVRGDAAQQRKLRYRFLQTITEVHEQQLARDAGEVVWTPQTPAQPTSPVTVGPSYGRTSHTGSLSFDEAFEDWYRFDPSRPKRTVDDVKLMMREFREIIGDKPLDAVERMEVIRYRDSLTEKGRKPKTLDKKLAFLCAIFNVAVNNGRLTYNPASRVPIPKSDGVGRVPLDTDDLKRLFGSPLYTEGKRLGRSTGEAAVWLPLIALYQGCREEELAQMLIDDIEKVDGIWCLLIIDLNDIGDADDLEKRLKNKDSRRRLPIHPALIDAGLLRYHEQMMRRGVKRLFPTLKPDHYGSLGAGFSKAFMGFLRKTLGITDRRKDFHSLRHTFRDACREAGLDEEIADALMGHSSGKRMGRRYGSGFKPARLYEAIQKVSYPELTITPIVPEKPSE